MTSADAIIPTASSRITTSGARPPNYGSLTGTESYSAIDSLTASTGQLIGSHARNVIHAIRSTVTVVFLVLVLIAALIVIMGINQKPSLENVQDVVLFLRHGERQPLIPIPGMGNYKMGELTPQGQKQMTTLGSHLLQVYAPFIDLVSRSRVVAANEQRCTRSAEIVMEVLGLQYTSNIIPYMEIKPTDPNYGDFVEREKKFAAAVPDSMKLIAMTMIRQLNISLPEEFKLLYGVLIADSLDLVREEGVALPFGLDNLVPLPDGPFLTAEVYDALTELATATFSKPVFRTFVDEVRQHRQSSSLTMFSFSDIHVSGLMSLIDNSKKVDRPAFGAHLSIHFRGDYLDIYYSPSFDESLRKWLMDVNADEMLDRIEKAVTDKPK